MPELALTTLWIIGQSEQHINAVIADFVVMREWSNWRLSPNECGILKGSCSVLVEVFGDIANDFRPNLHPEHSYGDGLIVEEMPHMGIVDAITLLRKKADQGNWN